MTDPNRSVIDLTQQIITGNSWFVQPMRSPTRESLLPQAKPHTSLRIFNEIPIEVPDSPDVSIEEQTNEPPVPRKDTRTTNKKNQVNERRVDSEDPVRERSPLGDGFGVCPICLETLRSQPLVSTKCGHVYCQKCLTLVLRTEKKCPTCRKPLKGKTAYHPLFLHRG